MLASRLSVPIGYVSIMPGHAGRDVVIRRRVVVRGLVQGVFFRDTCRREARSRRVSGSVRNLPDGSVEAVFEGQAESVEAMIAWSRRGPDLAEVTGVEVTEEAPQGETQFRVS
jgi:acylphosphatase